MSKQKNEYKQENCCTPIGQIKRYVDCVGCDRKPKQMSKQTAVEWLVEQILKEKGLVDLDIEKAKEMEKEQIKEAYMSALPYGLEYSHYDKYANKYYNEIYKKEDK